MTEVTLAHNLNLALVLTLILSAPPLIVAAVVGLTVGLLQAVTQVQDQSLPLVFKIIAVFLSVVIVGPLMAAPLVEFADQVLKDFPAATR